MEWGTPHEYEWYITEWCHELNYIHNKINHIKAVVIVTGIYYLQYSLIETISYYIKMITQFTAELINGVLPWHVDGIIPRLITQDGFVMQFIAR